MLSKPAVIEDFEAPAEIKKGDILEIQVRGYMSNLSWKLAEAKAQIDDNEITLIVIGEKPSGMMGAQALKNYQTTIKVKKLKPGEYKLKALKGTQKEQTVTVK